jgi:hypothetical protein
MADNLSAQVINDMFLQKLSTEPEKVASSAGAFIRKKLREVSFARKILMPEYVTKADCQRSLKHDQLVKIVDIEPDSKAMAVNFRGAGDVTYVEGDRYEISFYKVESDTYQKTESELLAYEMPLTELIEKNTVKDIQTIEDQGFMTRVKAAISVSSKNSHINTSGTYNGKISPEVFITLFNLLENSSSATSTAVRLKTDLLLMNQADFNEILLWSASTVGDTVGSEMVVNGYKYGTLFGKKLITTIKGDLVKKGCVYAFAAKEYLGHSYILDDTKFWIKKEKDVISWVAWELIGMGIGNTDAIAVVTFGNTGSAVAL